MKGKRRVPRRPHQTYRRARAIMGVLLALIICGALTSVCGLW